MRCWSQGSWRSRRVQPAPLTAGDCPRCSGRPRLLPLARVCQIRWKSPHSNQRGPIRAGRARPFPSAAQPGLRSRPPPLRGAGAGRGLACCPGYPHNTATSGYPAPPAAGTPWRALCTASPSGTSAPAGTCPFTSPPLVSAWGARLPPHTLSGERRGWAGALPIWGRLLWLLPPLIAQKGSGNRLRRSESRDTTCCPAAGASCCWFCLTWLE